MVVISNAESEQGVAQAILRGVIDFKREPWPSISESAKSLVRQMLEPDPKLRLTAKQVLGMFHICHYIYLAFLFCPIKMHDVNCVFPFHVCRTSLAPKC